MWLIFLISFIVLLFILGIIYFKLVKSFTCQNYEKIKKNTKKWKNCQGGKG
ncbi:MAG: hypothetical protein K9L96_00710 [Candidatus Omnitrophica bacterium]|nr:hypothetical protein [Candidatus Omnitrophota bacterium]